LFTILLSALSGAVLGVGYALGRTSDTNPAAIISIHGTAIDDSRAQTHGYAVGRIRLAACFVMGVLGAFIGGIFGLIIWFLHS
jgi:hypothetical protein